MKITEIIKTPNHHLPIEDGRKIKSFSSNLSVCKLSSDPTNQNK